MKEATFAAPAAARRTRTGALPKKKLSLPRTPLTRTLACLLALAVVAALAWWVDSQVGNPVSAWYTEQKITAHYRTYHPGENYIVGPAKYQFVIAGNGVAEYRYVCSIYKRGSVDTGFTAYFENGAVLETQAVTTATGVNTYNRFRNRLNEQLAEVGILKALELQQVDMLFADFYGGASNADVFSAQAPVFVCDAAYDFAHLPLPTVACLTTQVEPGEVSDETLARILFELRKTSLACGMPFDYYTVQLYSATGEKSFLMAMDAPAEELKTEKAASDYVAQLSDAEKGGAVAYDRVLQSRKYAVLNAGTYTVCSH